MEESMYLGCSFVGGGILPQSRCNLKQLGTGTEYIQTKLMICLLYYCRFSEDRLG